MLKRSFIALIPLALTAGGIAAQNAPFGSPGTPAWLGVAYEARWTQSDAGCQPQVLVERVVQGSPADRAGLRSGDIIAALDGQPLTADRLDAAARRMAPGDSLHLHVRRAGTVQELTAVADRRPARPPAGLAGSLRSAFPSTSAPVVHLEGDTLVARNIAGPVRVRGYWLASEDGATQYRRLGSWAGGDRLDERVARLMECAARSERNAAPPTVSDRNAVVANRAAVASGRGNAVVALRQVQQRADSLRVVMARRALENELANRVEVRSGRLSPVEVGSSGYVLRLEDHVAAELRGVAGAEVTTLEPEMAEYFRNVGEGLLVLRVADGTPADRAGLRPGDVLVEGNGRGLETVAELRALLSGHEAQPLQLRAVRNGRPLRITLRRP